MLIRIVAFLTLVLSGQASAQESYFFGGLGWRHGDFAYNYTAGQDTVSFDAGRNSAFLGFGRTFFQSGQLTFAGEVDIAFGDLKSDLILVAAPPCSAQGCTAEVNSLVTLRLVAAAGAGKLRPFGSLGLAVGDVVGSADFGACANAFECDYDERLVGFAASLGLTYDVTPSWQLRSELLFVNMGEPEFTAPDWVTGDITLTEIRLGAQVRF